MCSFPFNVNFTEVGCCTSSFGNLIDAGYKRVFVLIIHFYMTKEDSKIKLMISDLMCYCSEYLLFYPVRMHLFSRRIPAVLLRPEIKLYSDSQDKFQKDQVYCIVTLVCCLCSNSNNCFHELST